VSKKLKGKMNNIGKFEQYINEEEISQPRTAEEFIGWFEKKLAITNERRELRGQLLRHEGIAKILYEELFPLYNLLKNKKDDWKKEKFKPVIGNQNYDVEVYTDRKDVPQYIEITTATMNEDKKSRMKYFIEHGSVNLTGNVSRKRDKKTGKEIISVEDECRNHNEGSQEIKDRIKELVTKKIEVVKRPDSTALLVHYDDYMYFRYDNDASKREMSEFIDSIETPWQGRYSTLYVVGASGKSFFEKCGKN
jgi:hypothetical protein